MARRPGHDSFIKQLIGKGVSRRAVLKGAVGGTAALVLGGAIETGVAAAATGPGTAVQPYVLPSTFGVTTKSILTVGDKPAKNGYRMVGIPDGLGVIDGFGRNFSLFVNHEIPNPLGTVRAHGSIGAFVSQWTIDSQTLEVSAGKDLTQSPSAVFTWDIATKRYVSGTTQWQRLCSADMPDPDALRHNLLGTTDRIFLDGEEVNEGRAWARIASGIFAGQAWQLPRLGRMAFENVVASPHARDKTVVMMMDDGSLPAATPVAANNPAEVFCYVGNKQLLGSPIEKAGLTNGKLYGLRVYRGNTLVKQESNDFGLGDSNSGYVSRGRFELVEMGNHGDVSSLSGLELETDAISKNILQMQRPEDGAWDPRPVIGENSFYFVTTASISNVSRLWHLTFLDADNPELGGFIEIVLNNTIGRMFDNLTIDKLGRILIQEDTGNDPHVSKIWLYNILTQKLVEVAHHDEELFVSGVNPAKFITQDEESSGIIDAADILGSGWFLLDVQVHKASSDPELVEGGQLVAMYVPPFVGFV